MTILWTLVITVYFQSAGGMYLGGSTVSVTGFRYKTECEEAAKEICRQGDTEKGSTGNCKFACLAVYK